MPAILPENTESTNCCDVETLDPNMSFQFFRPVSVLVLARSDASQFGPDNFLIVSGMPKPNVSNVMRSIYVGRCSSTIQHLKSFSISLANGSYNFTYTYSPITTLLVNNAV